ncbi:YhcN/YlaJ family sporulation lipoprotein [Priestia flexa]|uniref:YhcN/YlaJ family sporulation lipoprotein n=1 Tax=Priestia flexa TaxID=86664 RepID=UPI002E1C3AC0|nr:YhcN/YlaJ family sporulation lipoprotein [Priestia flexa]MED3823645.1 YhcN/YlaJ family sporulation lipoprotein [Priestia flexa]
MIKKSFFVAVSFATILSLFGCNTTDQGKDGLINDDTVRNVSYENEMDNNMNDVTEEKKRDQYTESRMEVANGAADRVNALSEVKNANVVIMNRDAYVAAVLEDKKEGKLTKEMETKIADEVKKSNSNIQEVYVSTNPYFVNRMNSYVNKLEDGQPITGIINEFNEVVRRVFPNNR